MYFANPWGLLGLLALPIITWIHLYQRRFPPLEIAGLHLWDLPEQTKAAGTRLDRLPITRSLLLELLVAFLLVLLIARPQWSFSESATHWIITLDNSASMLAETGQGESFRGRALEKIRERVAGTGRSSRVSIITSGIRPTMLVGPAAKWSDAESVLEQWVPQDTRHDFQPTWDMASQLADNQGKLVFITDQAKPEQEAPPTFEWVSVGESLSNLAFEVARWSIHPDTLQQNLYVRVRNHSDQNLNVDVVGTAGQQEVFRRSLAIEPGAGAPLSTELPGGLKRLSIRLESMADRLKTDSQLELVEPKIRTVSVALSLDADHPVHSRLLRVLRNLPAINLQQEPANFYISSIEDDAPPSTDNTTWSLALGPLNSSEQSREDAIATSGPYLIERRNSLLEGLSLQGVIWAGIQPNTMALQPMISAGPHILLGRRADRQAPSFVLNIDFQTSNLTDNPDWPILISNFIESCRNDLAGLQRWNYQINEIIRFKLPPENEVLTDEPSLLLKRDTFERQLVRGTPVETPPMSTTGIYEIVDGAQVLDRFAVNFFDSHESDLTELATEEWQPTQSTQEMVELSETAPWVWMLLIAASLVVMLTNWGGLKQKVVAGAGESGS